MSQHARDDMKRIIMFVVILAAVCTASSFLAYRAGFARAKQLQKGTFVGTLDALQKLRAGDVADVARGVSRRFAFLRQACFTATLITGTSS